MIERLNQLSLCHFIELSCGDTSVLLSEGDTATDAELKERASKLIIEYRNVSDPLKMKVLIAEREEHVKERAKILFLSTCLSLISLGFYDEARKVLKTMSYYMDSYISDELMKTKVEGLLRTALFEHKRNKELNAEEEKGNQSSEQIRTAFDAEIAFLMTHFKMNIDVHVTNASVYANIVHQAFLELSAKRQ